MSGEEFIKNWAENDEEAVPFLKPSLATGGGAAGGAGSAGVDQAAQQDDPAGEVGLDHRDRQGPLRRDPMGVNMDAMAEIAQERSAAQAALAEAERMMKIGSRDVEAFRKAKQDHVVVVEAIERLDWAEKAEQERQVAAERQAKVDALRDAQKHALAAHERAQVVGVDLRALIETMVTMVKELQAAQAKVERGVRFETFGKRDGYLDRQTVLARIKIDGDVAVRILRAGLELAILSWCQWSWPRSRRRGEVVR